MCNKFLANLFVVASCLCINNVFCMQEVPKNDSKDIPTLQKETSEKKDECKKRYDCKKELEKLEKDVKIVAYEGEKCVHIIPLKESLDTDKDRIQRTMQKILEPRRHYLSVVEDDTGIDCPCFYECGCIHREARFSGTKEIILGLKKNNYKGGFNYLGFACGELYPDLRILTMWVSNNIKNNKEDKINVVHLVDWRYKELAYRESYKSSDMIRIITFAKLLSEFQGQPIHLIIHGDLESCITFCKDNKYARPNLSTIIDPDRERENDLDKIAKEIARYTYYGLLYILENTKKYQNNPRNPRDGIKEQFIRL